MWTFWTVYLLQMKMKSKMSIFEASMLLYRTYSFNMRVLRGMKRYIFMVECSTREKNEKQSINWKRLSFFEFLIIRRSLRKNTQNMKLEKYHRINCQRYFLNVYLCWVLYLWTINCIAESHIVFISFNISSKNKLCHTHHLGYNF